MSKTHLALLFSVYTLWKVPDLLPVFKTYPEVFPRLAGGAGKIFSYWVSEKSP